MTPVGVRSWRRRSAAGRLTRAECAATWMLASWLLDYPDAALHDRLPDLADVADRLPAPVSGPLLRVLAWLEAGPHREVAAHYVATFDHSRRCCLYLTYYAHGDTRRRGAALLGVKEVYAAAGVRLRPDELPDHLAVVLEFAAAVDPDAGQRLLLDHRAGLELLRLALSQRSSPYADVLTAVCATLPPLRDDDEAAVARLAAAGPPAERVGTGYPAGPAGSAAGPVGSAAGSAGEQATS